MDIQNADTFAALTLSKTLGEDGIKPNLSLWLLDARTLVVLGLTSLLAFLEEPRANIVNKNCPLLLSAMAELGDGSKWIC